jgi:prepilin-type N-terminal cleavage/methylation domain-containing protein
MSTNPRRFAPADSLRRTRGFTLVELMITLGVLAIVVIALTTVIYSAARSKTSSSNGVEASQGARVAMDMIERDLRSAGYGIDLDYTANPQPPIAYIDSVQILINENQQPWPDTLSIGHGVPLAYSPTGNPKPYPLNGTSWQPVIRYRTGAEIIRWTLDTNNDGVVTAADIADPNGVDAQRTPNPNDYELVRQVYGDSTGNTAGNNGGSTERVALIRVPNATVAPIFTVYMKNSSTPYNWASGPVPAAQLANIARVVVKITAPSGKPNWRGQYAETSFQTQVNSLRNIPDFGATLYGVDGYVYNDLNSNHVRDAGETGIPGAAVHLGAYSVNTPASGYFLFQAPAGTYTLWHTPAVGYTKLQSPDSVTVAVTGPATHSYGDGVLSGGTVKAFVYNDLNDNAIYDAGDTPRSAVKLTLNPGAQNVYSNGLGNATLWAPVGAYTVTATPPDSYAVTTTNPYSSSMVNGDSASIRFGVYHALTGVVRGTVFRDNNRNGVLDAGETGIQGVWVGVTPDGGITVPGYQYTDVNGQYSIQVAINDPPHTTAYSVMCIPPSGFFPTGTTSLGSIWLQDGTVLTGKDFGMSTFQVITLNASRVLSLGSKDMVEKDYTGTISKAHADADIVLGADAAGTDQITVWFNQWNASTLFNSPILASTDGYTRSAPASVLSLALDFLDTTSPERPDLVTGTTATASGNFFLWFAQNTNGNEGFYKNTYDAGKNYKTSDNGDVQAVLTLDCAGGVGADKPDIVVGTKSPTANQGSIEVWKNNNAATPSFTRDDTYTTFGSIIGEVTGMVSADFNGDGKKDIAFCTRTGTYSGQVIIYKGTNKSTTPHFLFAAAMTFPLDAFTSITAVDADGDGLIDLVAGSQTGNSTGKMRLLHNITTAGVTTFVNSRTVDAPGVVCSLASADFGGNAARGDVAMGFRQSSASFVGGVRIYFLDSGTLPSSGVDPSSGSTTNWVPALNANDFNFGANPSATAPFLPDLAAGVKITSTTGALVVFVR